MGVMPSRKKKEDDIIPIDYLWIKKSIPDRGWYVEYHGQPMVCVILMGSVQEAAEMYAKNPDLGFENTFSGDPRNDRWVTVSQFAAFDIANRNTLIKYAPCIHSLSAAIYSGNREMMEWVMGILGDRAGIIWDDSCQDALASLDYETTDWFVQKYPKLALRMKLRYVVCHGNTRLLEFHQGEYDVAEKRDAIKFGLFGNSVGVIDAKFFAGRLYWAKRLEFIKYLKSNEEKTGIVLSDYDFLLQQFIVAVGRITNSIHDVPGEILKEIAMLVSEKTNVLKMAVLENAAGLGDSLKYIPNDCYITLDLSKVTIKTKNEYSLPILDGLFEWADRNENARLDMAFGDENRSEIAELFITGRESIVHYSKIFAQAIYSPDNLKDILAEMKGYKTSPTVGKSVKQAISLIERELMEMNIERKLIHDENVQDKEAETDGVAKI